MEHFIRSDLFNADYTNEKHVLRRSLRLSLGIFRNDIEERALFDKSHIVPVILYC